MVRNTREYEEIGIIRLNILDRKGRDEILHMLKSSYKCSFGIGFREITSPHQGRIRRGYVVRINRLKLRRVFIPVQSLSLSDDGINLRSLMSHARKKLTKGEQKKKKQRKER